MIWFRLKRSFRNFESSFNVVVYGDSGFVFSDWSYLSSGIYSVHESKTRLFAILRFQLHAIYKIISKNTLL